MLGNVQEWTTDLYHPVFDNIEMQSDELYNKDPFGCMINRGRGQLFVAYIGDSTIVIVFLIPK